MAKRCHFVLIFLIISSAESNAASLKCIQLLLKINQKWSGYYPQLENFIRGSAKLNQALRGILDNFDREIELTLELQEYAKTLITEIKHLDSFQGRTFRGTALPNKVLDKILKSKKFVDKGFLSSSSELNVGETFAKSRYSNLETEVLFVIDSKKGKLIPNKMNHLQESEVVFLPATRFKVTKVEYSPFTEGYKYIRIYLIDD